MRRLIPALLGAVLGGAPLHAETIREADPQLKATLEIGEWADAPDFAAFMRAEAVTTLQMYRDMAAENPTGRPYELRVTDETRYDGARFVSVLRTIFAYTGGAHGNTYYEPLTWDRVARDFVRLDAFLKGPKRRDAVQAIVANLRAGALALHDEDGRAAWREPIEYAIVPDVTVLKNFTLAASTEPGKIAGFAFHFAPYEIGPYAMGPHTIVIPAREFIDGVAPDLRPMFGGELKGR